MLKLHIGCGKRFIPGWVHVDLSPYPHVDHIISAAHLTEVFGPNSSQELYACHILEHFHRDAILHVLEDWRNVLCPNGVLRLAVPDFAAISAHYQETGSLTGLHGLLYGGQDCALNFHHCAFDENSLSSLLTSIGFTGVERYDWRSTGHSEIDDFSQAYLPHMDRVHGRLMSLNLVARK